MFYTHTHIYNLLARIIALGFVVGWLDPVDLAGLVQENVHIFWMKLTRISSQPSACDTETSRF